MIKNKRQMFTIIGVFTLMLLLGTTTYAFFNYTRTGSSNNIRVGRISFVSKNEETISLNNLFPIDPTEQGIMEDSTKVGTYSIDIKGDTDYVDGIEYLVSAVDANIYTSEGQIVPITLDFTVTDLGDPSANYFTARDSKNANIYKKLVGDTLVGDQMLLVGYIKPNTTSGTAEGVDGSITIKAYLDKNKILISDTYDGTESDNMGTSNSLAHGKTVLTTAEWNALQTNGLSFKVKVEANEGIWIKGSLEEIMRQENFDTTKNRGILDNEQSTFVSASTGIDFGAISSDTNGKGVYERAGTENDSYPILYYRGAVDNNNVILANKCWKAVRTTETGGVKLIYSGELSPAYDFSNGTPLDENEYTIIQNDYGFTFNQNEKKYVATMPEGYYELGYFSFKIPDGDDYSAKVEITGNHEYDGGYYYLSYDGSWPYDYVNSYPYTKYWTLGTSTESNTISFYDELFDAYYGTLTIKIQVLKNTPVIGQGCDNEGTDTHISVDVNGTLTNMFAFNTNDNSPAYNGYMYGDVYTAKNASATSGAYFGSSFTYSNGEYTLTNATTTKDSTHHYTCNLTSRDGTCTTIRYYYYENYYVNLTSGDGIEEALTKMQANTNDSNAKEKIDTWYASNLASYTNKLEDTIWCNDRSMGDGNNNGWIANGGDLSTNLDYGAFQRSNWASNTSTVKNQPSLACTNKNDRFTVNNANGNRALTYPTALLTEDEMVLAGGSVESVSSFYLNNGVTYYWFLSPDGFIDDASTNFAMFDHMSGYSVIRDDFGLRPAISIKLGQLITKGTGTATDPYVIE